MDKNIGFGSVFQYRGDDFVYFAEDVERNVIFAGKILDSHFTRSLIDLETSRDMTGRSTTQNPAFSYVVLATKEFEKRAVMCAPQERENGIQLESDGYLMLNDDDQINIRQQIKDGGAPERLRTLIQLLEK